LKKDYRVKQREKERAWRSKREMKRGKNRKEK
jgi:hypothetical protein